MKNNNYMYKFYVNKALSTYPQEKINVYSLTNGKFEMVDNVFKYLIELMYNLSKKNNNYIMKLLIGIENYLNYYKEAECKIDKKDIDNIKLINNIYEKLLEEENREKDKNIVKLINEITDYIKENYNDTKEEDISIELNKQIIEKENEIKKLLRELENLKESFNNLLEKNNRFDKIKQNLHNNINNLEEKLDKIEQENKKLKQINNNLEIETNNNKINNETMYKQIETLKNDNKKLNLLIATLKDEIEILKKEITEYNKKQTKEKEIKTREQTLDELLINRLLNKKDTLNQLFSLLQNKGYNYTIDETKESLIRIRKIINIENPYIKSIPVEYHATSPLVSTNTNFQIYTKEDTYDLIITSDWHLSQDNLKKATIDKINNLYNYCVSNHINLILNLGDFLDVNQKEIKPRYKENIITLETILKVFPQEKSISHAILGGNHDRRLLDIGVDPLSFLSNNREDFVNIGYDDANLKIYNHIIGLHHPNVSGLHLDDIVENQNYIIKYLKDYYKKIGLSIRDSYIDLFGHFHLSRFDNQKGFCFVPPFIKSNNHNNSGMWHVKIYLTDEKKINYIIIKSLTNNDKLITTNEYVYKKK